VLQYIAQVFPRVLAPGELQRDLLPLLGGHDTGRKHAGTLIGRLARQMQHANAGIVVVQHFALSRLPDQFVARRLDYLRGFFHDVHQSSHQTRSSCEGSRPHLSIGAIEAAPASIGFVAM